MSGGATSFGMPQGTTPSEHGKSSKQQQALADATIETEKLNINDDSEQGAPEDHESQFVGKKSSGGENPNMHYQSQLMANFDAIAQEEDRLDDEEEEEEQEEPVFDEEGNLIDEGVDACEVIYDDINKTGRKFRRRI